MSFVQALFRTLHVTAHHGNTSVVSFAPTHATRDGKPSERNKSFSLWTPSGKGELTLPPDTSPVVRGLFVPGDYLALDIRAPDDEINPGATRTHWDLVSLSLRPDQFVVELTPAQSVVNFGDGWVRGSLEMTITNLSALPFFHFFPSEDRKPSRYAIDFTRE